MINQPEERIAILKMIEDSKITAEEGLKLLESLGKGTGPATSAQSSAENKPNGRTFRVAVTDLNTGKPKVNITIPMSLVQWGLRIGSRFSGEIEGVDMQELGEILKTSSEGKIIDVMDEEGGEHIEIYID